jgi:hypothetical protein
LLSWKSLQSNSGWKKPPSTSSCSNVKGSDACVAAFPNQFPANGRSGSNIASCLSVQTADSIWQSFFGVYQKKSRVSPCVQLENRSFFPPIKIWKKSSKIRSFYCDLIVELK